MRKTCAISCWFYPFFCHLVRPEVEEYNSQHPGSEPLVDPSSELIDVTLMLLTWYRQFRRTEPVKDEDDISELKELGDRYLNMPE